MQGRVRLPVEELSPSAFAPYGTVIGRPPRAPDATGSGWTWWAESALMHPEHRPFSIGYLDLQPAELRFDWAERHMRTAEVVIPTGGACLVYVGPPENLDEPQSLPPLERFRVFEVLGGCAVMLDPGVWHGAPLALHGALNVLVLLLQHTGRDDTALVRFADRPVEIER